MFKQFDEVTSTTLFAIFHQKQTKNENTLLIPKDFNLRFSHVTLL